MGRAGRKIAIAVGVVLVILAVWGGVIGISREARINPTVISADSGDAYIAPAAPPWPWMTLADGMDDAEASRLLLLEDGKPLGPPHTVHADIRAQGAGRFSHWGESLWFSASDGSDPRANGKAYVIRDQVRLELTAALAFGAAGLLLLLLGAGLGRRRGQGPRAPSPVAAADPVSDGSVPIPPPPRAPQPVDLRDEPVDQTQAEPPTPPGARAPLAPNLLLAALGGVLAYFSGGILFWAGMSAAAAGLLSLAPALLGLARPRRAKGCRTAMLSMWLLCASLGFVAMMLEGYLKVSEAMATAPAVAVPVPPPPPPPAAATSADARDVPRFYSAEAAAAKAARQGVLTMPPRWERRDASVEGASIAYYWHDVLHIRDANGFRRSTPIPPKSAGTYRIAVFGDSLTYGEGLPERLTYTGLLGEALARGRIEVLNLGVSGAQTEDILATMRRVLPGLEADLVIYGVCLNDFLNSWQGQYDNTRAYAVPLPREVQNFFLERTSLSRFLDDSYDSLLRQMRLRIDFFDDILTDFDNYQTRFGRDVREMNSLVTGLGLPPVVATVLDQFPQHGGRGYRIAMIAEDLLGKAGMTVLETEAYYRAHSGKGLGVSRWEGHPDEEAHALFAERVYRHLIQRGDFRALLMPGRAG